MMHTCPRGALFGWGVSPSDLVLDLADPPLPKNICPKSTPKWTIIFNATRFHVQNPTTDSHYDILLSHESPRWIMHQWAECWPHPRVRRRRRAPGEARDRGWESAGGHGMTVRCLYPQHHLAAECTITATMVVALPARWYHIRAQLPRHPPSRRADACKYFECVSFGGV